MARLTRNSIIMLVIGFALPVVITWLTYLPCTSTVVSKLRPYIIWPSAFRGYHVSSMPHLLGRPPTLGQLQYILVMLVLNIVFAAVDYRSRQPNPWNPTVRLEIMSYLLGRTGVLAFILMPLLFLFAGRNNILLWMTDWSHSTFLLLHRWIARIFTLQVLVHSIVSLVKIVDTGMYSMEVVKSYWIWGVVATLAVVILCFASGLHVRKFYQSFLVVHILLSLFTVVGCWYHTYDLYGLLGGDVYWVYATAAVWAFDRAGRLLRILMAGPCHARVTDLGDDNGYVRIDVPGVRWSHKPGMHAYLYFPSLSPYAPWVNHPFSVMPTVMLQPSRRYALGSSRSKDEYTRSSDHSDSNEDTEKSVGVTSQAVTLNHPAIGLTYFVRKGTGTTKRLLAEEKLLTLVEGPYPNNSTEQVLKCDRLLLLGGGIGITALVPFLASHYNAKLCWSLKESGRCLLNELKSVLDSVAEKDIQVGGRLDLQATLAGEAQAGWKKVGVVVAGPGKFCDDVRALVVSEAKRCTTTEFALEVEAYSW